MPTPTIPREAGAPAVRIHAPLTGQKALVTGANSSIGRGVAIALGQAGADVVVNYVAGDDAAHAVVEEIRGFGVKAIAHMVQWGWSTPGPNQPLPANQIRPTPLRFPADGCA